MKRRAFYFSLVVISITVLFNGCLNRPEPKVYHVGILAGISYFSDVPQGFEKKMAEFGYKEGENITYDLRQTDFDMDLYRKILGEFIKEKVDLIFTFPTEVAQEAKTMTEGTGIPVVFVGAGAVETGLIDNIRRPGKNITGVRWVAADVALLRFETMKELVPQAKRFLIPYQKDVPIVAGQLEAIHLYADKAGVRILEVPAENPKDLQEKMRSIPTNASDAILLILDPLSPSPQGYKFLSTFAAERDIPIGGTPLSFGPDSNGLFGLNPDNVEMGEQAAVLVDRIFKGLDAGSLPVSSAMSYLTINYKAAQKRGIEVSPGLLARAQKIIR